MPQKSSTSGFFVPSRKTRDSLLTNLALIFIVLVALVPIGTTVLISFNREEDVTRKPPVIFPCDTATSKFDLTACRWSIEGYDARDPGHPVQGHAAGSRAEGPDAQHLSAQHGALCGRHSPDRHGPGRPGWLRFLALSFSRA